MEIELEIKNYRCFPDTQPLKIKIGHGFTGLIGVNNSGKSSLLRFFYEFRRTFDNLAANRLAIVSQLLRRAGEWGPGFQGVQDRAEVFHKKNDRDLELTVRVSRGIDGTEPAAGLPREMRLTFNRRTTNLTAADIPGFYDEGSRPHVNIGIQGNNPLLMVPGRTNVNLSHIADAFRILSDTIYFGPYRNAINVDAGQDYFDIKVGQAFIAEWRRRKTGAAVVENEAVIGLTDDIRRIFEFDTLEINASDDNRTLRVFANNRSYRLDELGAGLAQFIFVLANAAIRRPSFILIDEPEQNLHPSLQVDFLTTLASYAKIGLIFGTHSLGLARAVANRIYSLRKVGDAESEVRDFESTPRLSEFLGELSFSGYRELGFEKILLVEGSTDVTTFQQFLRQYQKNHEVVILPMGGAGLINDSTEQQLGEIKRICDRIVAVIDSEKDGEASPVEPVRLRFQEICRCANIECHILERRATENYLTDRAVKAVKGENFSALAHYEARKGHSPVWGKSENWKIAREMTKDELSKSDLGRILAAL